MNDERHVFFPIEILRLCRHEIFPQTAKHRIWTAAINEDKFLQYLVATPRQRFRYKKAFSTNLLILYAFLSYFRWIFRFFRGGMTTFMPKFSALLTILLLSYARSAINPRNPTFSINSPAFAQSAVTPSVTMHRTGTPRASTARCILVLSPLLCGRFPGFRLALHRRAHALWRSSRRSWSTPAHVRL